ncbi:cupin domain-containing protein [Nocardiopsis sp. CNT-189]|uniref:cupin domain-containing protein n=1 Tax=Nocardiopsis oceanisediminis TaxID=2816862 RepID=UPI003B33FF83
MPVVRPADAVVHEMHGSTFTAFANPGTGSRELCAWRVQTPAGTRGAAHTITREEVFLVTEGELHLTIEGRTERLRAGDVAIAPARSELRLDNLSSGPASAWVTTGVGLAGVLADGSIVAPPWAG